MPEPKLHLRVGRSKVGGYPRDGAPHVGQPHWRTACALYTYTGVPTTRTLTDVTCLRCLRRAGIVQPNPERSLPCPTLASRLRRRFSKLRAS